MNDDNLALMVSASDKETLKERSFGSVLAHAIHMGKHGKVFWQVSSPGEYLPGEFKYPSIKRGYFYLTSIKKVFYIFDIEFIKTFSEIEDPNKYIDYVPKWRLQNWRSEEETEDNWGYWILIKDIKELKRLYDIHEFVLAIEGKNMTIAPQTYSIILDEKFEAI